MGMVGFLVRNSWWLPRCVHAHAHVCLWQFYWKQEPRQKEILQQDHGQCGQQPEAMAVFVIRGLWLARRPLQKHRQEAPSEK